MAGRDLGPFVVEWFADLKAGGGQMRGLLDEGPDFAVDFLIANIAPHAAEPDASSETLLLCAVLVLARDRTSHPINVYGWEGMRQWVDGAFANFHDMGSQEAAATLVNSVIKRSQPGPSAWEGLKRRRGAADPAKAAAHERDMAALAQREIRTAKILDPLIDFDAAVMGYAPRNEGG